MDRKQGMGRRDVPRASPLKGAGPYQTRQRNDPPSLPVLAVPGCLPAMKARGWGSPGKLTKMS